MHPAPSVILFTTLSGLGLGLLAVLGFGLVTPTGLMAFLSFAVGYGLTLGGLAASAFHLGRPERMLRAFTQWRTSWLSREAVLVSLAMLALAPHALSLIFASAPLPVFGILGGLLCIATVFATAMIYTQLKTVPRWNHWTTPAVFLTAMASGGALLGGLSYLALMALPWLALALVLHWMLGDQQFAKSGSTLATATGLTHGSQIRQFEAPHTGANYLLREMVHVVGRKHALKLRIIGIVLACILPTLVLLLWPFTIAGHVLALLSHVAGLICTRWLFFAQAEHVVGLYYDQRG